MAIDTVFTKTHMQIWHTHSHPCRHTHTLSLLLSLNPTSNVTTNPQLNLNSGPVLTLKQPSWSGEEQHNVETSVLLLFYVGENSHKLPVS